jgi:hypothetical protein
VDRVKLLKLLWDSIGTEFGGRHELYEINYGGSTEEIRRYVLFGAQALGTADQLKEFVDKCLAEYDLDGWKVPDLANPGELSHHRANGTEHSGVPAGHATTAASSPAALHPIASGDTNSREAGGPSTDRRSYPGGFRNPYAG